MCVCVCEKEWVWVIITTTAHCVRFPFPARERPDQNRLHAWITASETLLRTGFSNPEIEPPQPPIGRPQRVMRFIYYNIILCAARRSSAGEISRRDHHRRLLVYPLFKRLKWRCVSHRWGDYPFTPLLLYFRSCAVHVHGPSF